MFLHIELPGKFTSASNICAWVIQDLVPAVREAYGPNAVDALIGITRGQFPPEDSVVALQLRQFAEHTGGHILDPNHLDFQDRKVESAVHRLTREGDNYRLRLPSHH